MLIALCRPRQVHVIFMFYSTLVVKYFSIQTDWLAACTAVSLKLNSQLSHLAVYWMRQTSDLETDIFFENSVGPGHRIPEGFPAGWESIFLFA